MKRWIRVILSLILLASITIPLAITHEVKAVDSYTRIQTVTITDTSGADRSNIPILLPSINSTYTIPLLYTNAGGTDTAMVDGDFTESSFMFDSILTAAYISAIPAYDSVTYSFLMGVSPLRTYFPIMVGNDGYITTSDNSSLEANTGNITVSYKKAFLDTSQVGSIIFNHANSITTSYDAINSIAVSVNGTASENQSLYDVSAIHLSNTEYIKGGQKIVDCPPMTVTSASFYLSRDAGATGTANVTVREAVTGAPYGTLLGIVGTIDISTLPVFPTFAWVTVSATPVSNPTKQDVRVLVEWDGSPANRVYLGGYDSNVVNGNYGGYLVAGSWSDLTSYDTTYAIIGISAIYSTSVVTTTGETDIEVSSNNVTGLSIVTNSSNNTESYAFRSFQLYDSTNDWMFNQGNSVIYADNISISINGTQVLWYQPQIYVTDTTLPNRASGGDYGTIHWGTNPTGLTITYGTITQALSVTTNGVGSISATYAYAQGTLDSIGTFTYASVSFQYGTTTSYGSTTSESQMTATGGFTIQLTPLSYNQLYHFRAVGRYGSYYVYGNDDYFTTLSAVGSSTDLLIRSAAVFSNYGNNGSLLFTAEVVCNYTNLYPDKKPGQYFSVQVLQTNATDILASTPLVEWGDRPVGIYINPTFASNNFTYGTQYYIRLIANTVEGSPASGNSTTYQLQNMDWNGSDLTNLDSWVRGTAYHMEIADNDYTYVQRITDGGAVISDAAGGMFTQGIPGITQERPNLFQTSVKQSVPKEAEVTSAWDSLTAWQTAVGSNIVNDITILSTPLGVNGKDFLTGLILLFIVFLIIVTGDKPLGVLLISVPIVWVGAYFKIVDIRIIIIPCIICLFLFVRQFYFKTT